MTTATTPDPGIYHDVPFDVYLAWDAISNSSLKELDRSPAHYNARHLIAREESDAMRLGSLVHAGRLEPLSIPERYVVLPPFEQRIRRPDGSTYANPKVTNAYKEMVDEFAEANPGKTVVSQEEYDRMKLVVAALCQHERANRLLNAPGPIEVAFIWRDPETGLLCKGRADKCGATYLADLKTSWDLACFPTHIAKRWYHRQAAMYVDGMQQLTGEAFSFHVIAAETTPPFCVRAAPLSEIAIAIGRQSYKQHLRTIADCRASGVWPGLDDPNEWNVPEWAVPDLELDMTGIE